MLDTRLFDGAVGNGYAMLRMAKYAKTEESSQKWMYRARQIANLIADRVMPNINKLDKIDFHLGDGYGGLICFLIDVLDPYSAEAGFPVFE